jgi:TrmH family RNA methyltransferase
MSVRLRQYKKSLDHSYVFGVFPTLELLQHKPDIALGILVHSKGSKNQGVQDIKKYCQEYNIPIQINDKLVEKLTKRKNDYAVGIFRKTQSNLNLQANHIVLHNPSGIGNLGTIIRTMIGFGFRDLAIIEPAVDHHNPKVVRASMGAIFQLNIHTYQSFKSYSDLHKHHYYPMLTNGESQINEIIFQSPFTLIFGNESSGLDDRFHTIGTSLRIPHSPSIDSLNIAQAVGIALYQVWISKES